MRKSRLKILDHDSIFNFLHSFSSSHYLLQSQPRIRNQTFWPFRRILLPLLRLSDAPMILTRLFPWPRPRPQSQPWPRHWSQPWPWPRLRLTFEDKSRRRSLWTYFVAALTFISPVTYVVAAQISPTISSAVRHRCYYLCHDASSTRLWSRPWCILPLHGLLASMHPRIRSSLPLSQIHANS